jgi:hypothetical protein
MTQSEPREPTRSEIASRWKNQREEYRRLLIERGKEHSNRLEQELWKSSKRIRKYNRQYLYISHTPRKLFILLSSLVISVIIGVIGIIGVINYDTGLFSYLNIENSEYLIEASQFFSPLFITGGALWGLHNILRLFNDKIIMDSNTKYILIRKLHHSFIPTRLNIPYSAIKRIAWNYKLLPFQDNKGKWIISIGEKNSNIDIISGNDEEEMSDLAIGISKFLGKELKIESNKPELPTPTFNAKKLPTDWKL